MLRSAWLPLPRCVPSLCPLALPPCSANLLTIRSAHGHSGTRSAVRLCAPGLSPACRRHARSGARLCGVSRPAAPCHCLVPAASGLRAPAACSTAAGAAAQLGSEGRRGAGSRLPAGRSPRRGGSRGPGAGLGPSARRSLLLPTIFLQTGTGEAKRRAGGRLRLPPLLLRCPLQPLPQGYYYNHVERTESEQGAGAFVYPCAT
ncbi:neuronal regeneration-related protein isoform X1 [Tympanuchus pallidicinctus]|uniref:neuronal regeneration-related protein isoform X1 n=1 Tax=Tympanuchus pallidicinctus TaxID=109042 RepID=UPI0022876F7E|nr:neuronal regeneration-related protein isoform X1 [Tympanuchus pallidicinctus]